jgi:hypothetical protein
MKLNLTIYRKLMAQAEEAQGQGLTKLASSIRQAISDDNDSGDEQYSYAQLNDEIHRDLWKLAKRIMMYYDVEDVEVEKLDKTILSWAVKMTDDLEVTLGVDTIVKGPLEPKLPGEDK